MADRWVIPFKVDLLKGEPLKPCNLQGIMLPGDDQGHIVEIKIMSGGEPAEVAGNVRGYFIRQGGDWSTVVCNGSLNGNVASVTMSPQCYAYTGKLRCVVRIENTNGPDFTLIDTIFYVHEGVGDNIVDPGSPIQDVTELLEYLDEMQEATENAQAATSYIAYEYSMLRPAITPYAVGDYVIHDGGLYRCTTPITSAETWTAEHWTQVVFGNEVSDLKSQFETVETQTALDTKNSDYNTRSYQITAGKWYRLYNAGTNKLNATVKNGGTTVQSVGILKPGGVLYFKANYNGDTLSFYGYSADVNGKTYISSGDVISPQGLDGVYMETIYAPTSSATFNYDLIAGATYRVKNNGAKLVYVRSKNSGTLEERFGTVAPGEVLYFTPTVNANQLDFYRAEADSSAELIVTSGVIVDTQAGTNENQTALNAMATGTGVGTGKLLTAKTVEGGRVTEWEYTDQVGVDSTFTQSGSAADAKTVGDNIDRIDSIIALEPGEVHTYYPLQMGACWQDGVSIDNMSASTTTATVPERISAAKVMTLYWDDTIYKLGLVPLNDNGTGKGDYYWFESSPYTTSIAPMLYRTFMIKRKDGNDIGNVDLSKILYESKANANVILDRIVEGDNEVAAESDRKISALARKSDNNGLVKYAFPDGFSWSDNPIADKVTTDGKGRFCVDYNVLDHISTTGVDVYVASDGDDSNDGLSVITPKKTIGSAIGVTNARRVHIAGGFYPREEITLTADIDLLGDPDNRAVFTGQNTNTVWMATAVAGVYTTDHKNYGKVYDLTDTSSGTYGQYTEAQDVATVQATQGTYYDDGTTMTIHTYGNAAPTLDKVCYAQGWSALRVLLKGHTALAAHLCFTCSGTYSGRGQLMFVGDSTDRGAFMLYNCDSSYSIRPAGDNISGGSAINPQNADGIIQYCTAYHAGNDGFSYGSGCKIVEIGCASAYNGTEDITSCNGSTAHGGSYIRINGAYHDTHGPVVHDVGATESVNLGLAAWHSTCEGKPNFCASGGAVKMWLDSCVSYSSDAGIDVGKPDESAPNAVIYKRNCTSDVADGVYGGHIYLY